MTRLLVVVLIVLATFAAIPIAYANSHSANGPHIKVSLLSEKQSIVLGKQQWLGVLLSPDPEWHTYWRNAGDSGEAPTINWRSSADINFGDIQWPIPEQIPVAHLVNYGYSDNTLLMVPITLNNSDVKTKVSITADLSWLVCKEDCIPGWATLSLELPITASAEPSGDADLFEQSRTLLPSMEKLGAQYEVTEQFLTLSLLTPYQSNWQLLPFRADLIQHNAEQQWLLDNNDDTNNVVLAKSDYFSASNEELDFLLTDGNQGYYLTAEYNLNTAMAQTETKQSLWLLLAFAFIGGLILNIMPCVLPILSLKAMAITHANEQHDSSNKNNSHWGYLVGILVSFWLFASVILLIKAGGNAVGWGFHLQEPAVISALAFLFVFIALMLWDIAPTGAGLANIGNKLTQGTGFGSQFFTGVLAVIVASPCTAPFMATALGVAMFSPALETFAIFSALALGFALPITLLSLSSRFAGLLPRPGQWMETFKQFLAFPMLATVIWLVWVFLAQTSSFAQVLLLSGLLAFALFIWLASISQGHKANLALLLALVTVVYVSVKASNVNRSELLVRQGTLQLGQNYSEQKLLELRSKEQVVLVNMTADWCITCKVNEQIAFSDQALQQVLQQQNVHYLIGDWTNKNQTILQYLTKYQRSGVPLYVVYAGSSSEQVLPQILTPEIVINAIKQAQQELNYANN